MRFRVVSLYLQLSFSLTLEDIFGIVARRFGCRDASQGELCFLKVADMIIFTLHIGRKYLLSAVIILFLSPRGTYDIMSPLGHHRSLGAILRDNLPLAISQGLLQTF